MKSLINRVHYWLEDNSFHVLTIFMVLFLSMALIGKKMFVMIEPGEIGVLFKPLAGGTDMTKVYDEGLHVIKPWNKMIVYNIRQHLASWDIDALSKDGADVSLSLAAKYLPKKLNIGKLHKDLGPDYKDLTVVPEVSAAIKNIVSQLKLTEISTSKIDSIQSWVSKNLDTEVIDEYVHVVDIIINEVQVKSN